MDWRTPNDYFNSPPYGGDVYKVCLLGGVAAWVHRNILFRYEKLASRIESINSQGEWLSPILVNLREVDLDTGHSILHFLYTRKYHVLQEKGLSELDTVKRELGLSLPIFLNAKKFDLPVLEHLAKQEIERTSDQLSLLSILEVMAMSSSSLSLFPCLKRKFESRIESSQFSSALESEDVIIQRLNDADAAEKILLRILMLQSQKEQKEKKKEGLDDESVPSLVSDARIRLYDIGREVMSLRPQGRRLRSPNLKGLDSLEEEYRKNLDIVIKHRESSFEPESICYKSMLSRISMLKDFEEHAELINNNGKRKRDAVRLEDSDSERCSSCAEDVVQSKPEVRWPTLARSDVATEGSEAALASDEQSAAYLSDSSATIA